MASKEREYIDKMRRQFRSPIELWKEIEARWGAISIPPLSGKDLEIWLKIDKSEDDYTAAKRIYDEARAWACWNDIAMQDYLAEACGTPHVKNDNRQDFIIWVRIAIQAMADHLKRGKELSLNELEQRVIDTLWGWVPHNYQDNYVDCAREVSKAIKQLLPSEDSPRSENDYITFYNNVMKKVKLLAKKFNVDFDTSDYNLSAGYFYEWLSEEYGMIFDDAWDRED